MTPEEDPEIAEAFAAFDEAVERGDVVVTAPPGDTGLLAEIAEQLYPPMMQGPREPITLVRAEGGGACPSQWEAYDAEGNFYYLHYRHSYGYVDKSPSEELWRKVWDAQAKRYKDTEVVASFTWGPYEDCGHISLEEFCAHAGIRLDFQKET